MALLDGRAPRAGFACAVLFASSLVAACSTFTGDDPALSTPDAATDADLADTNSARDASADGAIDDGGPDAALPDYAGAVLASGPLRYYRLDEAAGAGSFADATGGNVAPALAHGAGLTSGAPGELGNAVMFSGVPGSYIECGDLAALHSPADFAIELWVNRSGNPTKQVLVSNLLPVGDAGGESGIALRLLPDGTAQLTLSNGNASYGITSMSPLPPGGWAHLAVSYDKPAAGDATASMWIDGIRAPTITNGAAPGLIPQGGALSIGRGTSASSEPYVGLVDEVALYTHPLTDAKVAAHYAARVSP